MSNALQSLICDATNHLNNRQRGRENRMQRLADAGIPTEREALKGWLQETLAAQHEATGGLFHCCTARVSNGVDAGLPTCDGIGCRIVRVPICAVVSDDGEAWYVRFGNVGRGFMEVTVMSFDDAATAEEAERLTREGLLRQGDCVRTWAEAVRLVEEMLTQRVAQRLAK